MHHQQTTRTRTTLRTGAIGIGVGLAVAFGAADAAQARGHHQRGDGDRIATHRAWDRADLIQAGRPCRLRGARGHAGDEASNPGAPVPSAPASMPTPQPTSTPAPVSTTAPASTPAPTSTPTGGGGPTVPVANSASNGVAAQRLELLGLVNQARRTEGVPALKLSTALTASVSQPWTEQMVRANDFRHNPDFAAQTTANVTSKWSGVSENIAINRDVAGANTAFLNSPGHRANMLSPEATYMGIGIVKAANGQVWITENFVATSEALATTE